MQHNFRVSPEQGKFQSIRENRDSNALPFMGCYCYFRVAVAHVEKTDKLLIKASRPSLNVEGRPADAATRQYITGLCKSCRVSLSDRGFNTRSSHE